MNIHELISNMTPDVYQALKQAVEIGKWPNGEALTQDQKALCLQAVIAYGEQHLPDEERVGYIPPKEHTHCGSTDGDIADDSEQPLNFKH